MPTTRVGMAAARSAHGRVRRRERGIHAYGWAVLLAIWCCGGWSSVGGGSDARAEEASEPATRRNVLLIVADDLNCALGCYGDGQARTPSVDRLAERGTLFERAYCTFPLCAPSRNSFLTGLHPNASGILRNGQVFRQAVPQHVCLPQAFRQAGYFVARVGKLYHYGVPNSIGTYGHDDPASWELAINPAGCDRLKEHPDIFSLTPGQFGGTLSWYASPRPAAEHTDGLQATAAEWILERCAADRSRPFFLAVGFFRPHTPYVAPRDPYFGYHPLEKMPLVTGVAEDQQDVPQAALASAKPEQQRLTDDLRRQAVQAYYASVSFMDEQAGRVLAALERLGLAESTVVVFTSDHGYHLGEHGLWQKMSLFEGSARVPLVMAAPGVGRGGARAASPVSLVDLYPTLAELCGVATPANLQGQSLAPLLADPAAVGRGWALTQVTRSYKDGDPRRDEYFGYTLRTPRWRYTEWDEGRAGRELYDHEVDPQELHNLAQAEPNHPQLAALAEQLRGAVKGSFPTGGATPAVRPGLGNPEVVGP